MPRAQAKRLLVLEGNLPDGEAVRDCHARVGDAAAKGGRRGEGADGGGKLAIVVHEEDVRIPGRHLLETSRLRRPNPS